MLQKRMTLAVLFADISGSRSLYESLGDIEALKIVSSCITVFSGIVADHQGTIIKTIGDEVMCTFKKPDQAINAAIAIQNTQDSTHVGLPDDEITLNVRIGIHWGPVIKQSYDVFGDAVNVASKIVSMASPKQILTTKSSVDELPKASGIDIRHADRATTSGGKYTIYEVLWKDMDEATMLSNDITRQVIYCRLHLEHGGKELYLDSKQTYATLGRHSDNDLVVGDILASRSHARIELRRGTFVLIDQSTNGTYVSQEGKSPVFVHNDEVVLSANGIISMGRETDHESDEAIRFTYEYQG